MKQTGEEPIDADASGRSQPRLEIDAVTKRFPGVLALSEVSMQVMPGETLAVIGENGAGKSTLMKILAGIQTPDSGDLRLDGQTVTFKSPGAAIAAGISLIHQELNLHENLSVAENIFLGREPNHGGWVDRSRMVDDAAMYLQRVGLDVDPKASLATLSTAARQLVEVAKALSTDASIVIMDEPTSSLSTPEAERLFDVVDSLHQHNVSVVYISHRLGEVVRLADRVEVLRDGRNAGALVGEKIAHDPMVAAMVGRDVDHLYDRNVQTPGEVRLQVSGLQVDDLGPCEKKVSDPFCAKHPKGRFPAKGVGHLFSAHCLSHEAIDLSVRSGEVVGIAGLVGSGRSELLEAIFGIRHVTDGIIRVMDKAVPIGDVKASIKAGLALVPEDRKRTGLLIESSVRENATLAAMTDARAAPWVDRKWQQSSTAEMIDRLMVKTDSQLTTIANLSGGNQQKIALGKWLLCEPAVLLLDEPTRGVDVGAKQEIYNLLDRLAAQGLAILFVSSEMEEVLALADRVIVMHEGRVTGQLSRAELSEEAIMRLAVGMHDVAGSAATESRL